MDVEKSVKITQGKEPRAIYYMEYSSLWRKTKALATFFYFECKKQVIHTFFPHYVDNLSLYGKTMEKAHTLPLLVLVSGPPAVGKTTLAGLLAKRYRLPLFAKDTFKEMMYDNMAKPPSLEESCFLGKCSINTLQLVAQELLGHGVSHCIEANFDGKLFSPALQTIARIYPFACVQVQMECDGVLLAERFRARAASGTMHPGHQGLAYMESVLPALLQGKSDDVDIPSTIVRIDTTDKKSINYQPVFAAIEAFLPPSAAQQPLRG